MKVGFADFYLFFLINLYSNNDINYYIQQFNAQIQFNADFQLILYHNRKKTNRK